MGIFGVSKNAFAKQSAKDNFVSVSFLLKTKAENKVREQYQTSPTDI